MTIHPSLSCFGFESTIAGVGHIRTRKAGLLLDLLALELGLLEATAAERAFFEAALDAERNGSVTLEQLKRVSLSITSRDR